MPRRGAGGGCAPFCVEHKADDNSCVKMSKNIRFRQFFLSIGGELSILCI